MTIKKLMTLICSANILLVALTVALIINLNFKVDDYVAASEGRYRSYLLADELRQSSDDLTRLGRTYAITGNETYERMYFDILDIRNGKKARPQQYHKIYWDLVLSLGDKPRADGRVESLNSLMENAGFTEHEFTLLAEAQANSDALVGLEVKAMNAVKGRFFDESEDEYSRVGDPDFELARNLLHGEKYHSEKAKIMEPINRFFGELEDRTRQAQDDALASVSLLVTWATIFIVVILLVAIGSFITIKVRVSDRIEGVSRILKEIGNDSDLTRQLVTGNHDEVGMISLSINSMINEFREAIAIINNMGDSVRSITGSIIEIVENGRKKSDQQKSETTMAASAVEEMTAALGEVSQNTSEVSSHTQKTDEDAGRGKAVISSTIDQIRSLSMEFEGTSVVVNELAKQSDNVGTVLVVIKSIAEQTNLLALNAAIEAARAGEQGRGFAVVADEVRSLAQRTQESTTEIEDMIANLQSKAADAISSIGSGTKRLVDTTNIVEEAEASLINIVDSMEKLAGLTIMIATATEEQAAVSGEISSNIANIDEGSEEISAGYTNLTESAQQLELASNKMMESIQVFKV